MDDKDFDGWEIIRPIGKGGQGVVSLARSPQAAERRAANLAELQKFLAEIKPSPHRPVPERYLQRIVDAALAWRAPDSPADLGALKKFQLVEGPHIAKAHERFLAEVKALERFKRQGLLRLLHANQERHFIVTEFHPAGPLSNARDRFAGKALESLKALRPVVAAVAELHAEGVVHRDIKPENIFVKDSGDLVLGDFGIVHFEDPEMTRLSDTYDNVGSRDWMPAWAHGKRIDDVTATFDVFSLGKTLWSMVSGKTKLLLWYHREEEFDLERLFPRDRAMSTINDLLDQCVVEKEKQCLKDAGALLQAFDYAIDSLQGGKQQLRILEPRPCQVCGSGQYRPAPKQDKESGQRLLVVPAVETKIEATQLLLYQRPSAGFTVFPYICDACGHFQFFWQPDGGWRPAWRP